MIGRAMVAPLDDARPYPGGAARVVRDRYAAGTHPTPGDAMTVPQPPQQWPPQPQRPWPPQQPYMPPRPSRRGLPGWAIALIALAGVGVLAIVVVVALAMALPGDPAVRQPDMDLVSCRVDDLGFAKINYTVTNMDPHRHDIQVTGTIDHHPLIPDVLHDVGIGETVSGQLVGAVDTTGSGHCDINAVVIG